MADTTLDDVVLNYVETSDEASQFIEWIRHDLHGPVAVDTETTGLERDDHVRLVQFGDRDVVWTLRRDRWPGAVLEAFDVLQRARHSMVYHNAAFDAPRLERLFEGELELDWGLIDDTMILSRLSKPLGGHSLKALAARLVDPRARAMQSVLDTAMAKNGWTWATVPYSYEGYTSYAGIDCILTARLLEKLQEQPYDKDLYATEMGCLEACIEMSEVGMLVDEQYCEEQIVLLEQEIDDLSRQAHNDYGVKALGSNQMMINALHERGLTWNKRTDTGRIALDQEVLEELIAKGSDLARTILAYRTRVKLLNTYFRNFLSNSDDDNVIHPQINTLEAVTGRMSVTNPAMQTLPRGPRARRAFISRPGHQLVLADYAQIEMRLLAHFCKDPSLMEAVNSSDLHTAVAGMIFGADHVTREVRQLAKTSAFAVIYGAGPEKFSHTAGVTIEAGTEFLRQYHERFPRIRPFIDYVIHTTRQRKRQTGSAYIRTPAGRELHARKIDAEYTLCNYLIQGSAADIFKAAIVRLHENGLGEYMRLPVHDECIFEIPDDVDVQEFMRTVERVMSDDSWEVPIAVEAEGPFYSWANKYDEG